jgi:hypothetical protein
MVWRGAAGDCHPYADQTPLQPEIVRLREIPESRTLADLSRLIGSSMSAMAISHQLTDLAPPHPARKGSWK